MNVKFFARGVGYVALAAALLAAAIALSDRQHPRAVDLRPDPAPATGAFDAALALCKAIGAEAADDAVCKAVWEANRARFFQSRKLYQDRVTEAVPAASDSGELRSPLGRESPRSAPQSPTTHNSSLPRPAGDIAGQLK